MANTGLCDDVHGSVTEEYRSTIAPIIMEYLHLTFYNTPRCRVFHWCLLPHSTPVNLIARRMRQLEILPPSVDYNCSPRRRRMKFRMKNWNAREIDSARIPNVRIWTRCMPHTDCGDRRTITTI